MEKELKRFIGQVVEIIYLSSKGITQRQIEIHTIASGIVKAYCFERKAPRAFRIKNILAVQPAPLWKGKRTS